MPPSSPANTRRCPDVGPTLSHRLRRWPGIGPTSGQRLVFAGRGVARVMKMCTHNARGTDLQSFSETGREWIFPNSWLLFYGGNPHTRCAQPGGHGGGPGGLLRGKFEKKKIANGGI